MLHRCMSRMANAGLRLGYATWADRTKEQRRVEQHTDELRVLQERLASAKQERAGSLARRCVLMMVHRRVRDGWRRWHSVLAHARSMTAAGQLLSRWAGGWGEAVCADALMRWSLVTETERRVRGVLHRCVSRMTSAGLRLGYATWATRTNAQKQAEQRRDDGSLSLPHEHLPCERVLLLIAALAACAHGAVAVGRRAGRASRRRR